MKKFIKGFLVVSLLFGIFLVSFNTFADDASADRGDLRCTPEYKNVKCWEHDDNSDGKVDRVTIPVTVTSSSGNTYTLTKVAEKTLDEGTVKIHFEVTGDGFTTITHTTETPYADIAILLDYSGSFSSHASSAKAAIKAFSKEFFSKNTDGDLRYQIAYAQFNEALGDDNKTKKVSNYISSMDNYTFSWPGLSEDKHSVVNDGLYVVWRDILGEATSGKRSDVPSYLIVVSDGGFRNYGSYAKTHMTKYKKDCGSSGSLGAEKGHDEMEDEADIIKNTYNTTIMGIIYNNDKTCYDHADRSEDMNAILSSPNNLVKMWDNLGDTSELECDEIEDKAWCLAFNMIYKQITTGETTTYDQIVASGMDYYGEHFRTGGTVKKSFNIRKEQGASQPYKSKSFKVSIDETVPAGWYPTNDGFEGKIRIGTEELTIPRDSNVNPEIYWKPNQPEKECGVGINYPGSKFVNTVEDIYSIVCTEEFEGPHKINDGVTPIEGMYGFSSTLDFKTNAKCTYRFDQAEYNSIKADLEAQIAKAEAELTEEEKEFEIASLQRQLQDLEDRRTAYYNKVDTTYNNTSFLHTYSSSFYDIEASLEVTSTKSTKTVLFEEEERSGGEVDCSGSKENRTCTMNAEKKMYLPISCLDPSTGNQYDTLHDNCISGGRKFYPPKNEGSGHATLFAKHVTYLSLDVEAGGSKCDYGMEEIRDIFYRQIDVADPFVQNTAGSRAIGRNFQNNDLKYDFVRIIDANIWDGEYEYLFQLGKTDILDVKNETIGDSAKVKSYLGEGCSLDSNSNKIICPLVRELRNMG